MNTRQLDMQVTNTNHNDKGPSKKKVEKSKKK